MTWGGGKPHGVGDQGQRYEVTAFDHGTNKRFVVGWSETPEGAQRLANMVEAKPSWDFPQVTDRNVKIDGQPSDKGAAA